MCARRRTLDRSARYVSVNARTIDRASGVYIPGLGWMMRCKCTNTSRMGCSPASSVEVTRTDARAESMSSRYMSRFSATPAPGSSKSCATTRRPAPPTPLASMSARPQISEPVLYDPKQNPCTYTADEADLGCCQLQNVDGGGPGGDHWGAQHYQGHRLHAADQQGNTRTVQVTLRYGRARGE